MSDSEPYDVPSFDLPDRNRQVQLTTRPNGVPQATDFTLTEVDRPVPAEGEILVRNIYLSVDPAQRGWASDEANYSEPVPLGGPMRGLAVAQVIESRHAEFTEGSYVYGFFGWQDYAAVGPGAVIHHATQNLPLAAFGSLCGINGVTAYLALTELGRPRIGDTLLVSTAAGSVGGFVGQIGRSLGARCIGLTGSDAKAARCQEAFGYDTALNYKTGDLDAALAKLVPDGIDIYFDNVGGEILDRVLRRMAIGGRLVQCGTASIPSWSPPPTGPRNEREILTRRLVWSGFVIFDHFDRYGAACDALAAMYHDGALTFDTDLSQGIATAPGALQQLYSGQNTGKKLIFIG